MIRYLFSLEIWSLNQNSHYLNVTKSASYGVHNSVQVFNLRHGELSNSWEVQKVSHQLTVCRNASHRLFPHHFLQVEHKVSLNVCMFGVWYWYDSLGCILVLSCSVCVLNWCERLFYGLKMIESHFELHFVCNMSFSVCAPNFACCCVWRTIWVFWVEIVWFDVWFWAFLAKFCNELTNYSEENSFKWHLTFQT